MDLNWIVFDLNSLKRLHYNGLEWVAKSHIVMIIK